LFGVRDPVEAFERVIPARLPFGVEPLASYEAVLGFHEHPVLLAEVEVRDVVEVPGRVPEVESPTFAVSRTPYVDDVLVDPKR
jgi:hypothetical protein